MAEPFDARGWAEGFQAQFENFIDGLREDLRQRDEAQVHLTKQMSRMAETVSKLTAKVENLTEGQKGVFTRMNRPIGPLLVAGVAVAVSIVGIWGTILTLTVNPIKASVVHIEDTQLRIEEKELSLHIMLKEDIEHNMREIARQGEALRWVEKLEDRYNSRLHP